MGGAHELATEVVDDEATAQGLHVQGRLVVVADRVVAQVKHLEREFAAGNHERTPAGHPAGIEFLAPNNGHRILVFGFGRIELDVDAGIVDADDLAFHDDRIGHVDYVVEDAAERERGGSFAVARRPVEKNGAAGVQAPDRSAR